MGSVSLCKLGDACAELLKAHEYAIDARRNVWDFAVEANLLRRLGLTASDFRWLTCKGYVLHAHDVTEVDSAIRNFAPDGELSFTRRTCFVLTAAGVAFTRQLLYGGMEADGASASASCSSSSNGQPTTESARMPVWNAELLELSVGGVLVKRFKWPALNQETVLAAFQEEGWPPQIDDPLPPQPEQDSKRRLHDTIKSLNRNQRCRLIRFKGDGTGEGARWELIPRADVASEWRPTAP